MNAQWVRGAQVRGPRRRKGMIDLNATPSESRDQEGSSDPGNAQQVPADNHQRQFVPPAPPAPPPMIDVDAIEDDVVESSASAFAEAKNKSRSMRRRPVMVDVDSGSTTRLPTNIHNKRRRIPPSQPVIDCDRVCINVELTMSSRESVSENPSPPQEPTFTCPICMGPFTQETSTKCGHIFCKECIRTAITRQGKCPTCRKKLTAKDLIRVFLPAAR